MTALVTGAAGFLGRAVTARLLGDGQAVRVLVRQAEQAETLRACGAEVIVGDVRDAAVARSAIEGVSAVYHCATAHAAGSTRDEIFAVNVGGTRNVAEALRASGHGRLVFVSGINVLGTRNFDGPSEDLPWRRENDVLAQAKIEGEQLVLDYHRRHGVEAVVVRMPLIYGPGDRRNIPKLIGAIQRSKFAYIGSRENIIPMVHVDDVAEALRLAGTAAGASGRIYHISDGCPTTIRELAEYLAELMECPPPKKLLPYGMPAFTCGLFEWLRRLGLSHAKGPIDRVGLRFLGTSRPVDITRATRELGYQPKVEFRPGMAATVRWFREHGDG